MAEADPFEALRAKGFQIEFHSHARAILLSDFIEPVRELIEVLGEITVPIEEIVASGGGEAKGTQRLRKALFDKHWRKGRFTIVKKINDVEKESITHEIDHVRTTGNGALALEIEWNNKDPFFDRDLENFKRLHSEGAISVGVIITRGTSLQDSLRSFVRRFADERNIATFDDLSQYGLEPTRRQRSAVDTRMTRRKNPQDFRTAWTDHFVSDKFGAATTHWAKLVERIRRGAGNPCPLLAIGIPGTVVTFNEPEGAIRELLNSDEPEN